MNVNKAKNYIRRALAFCKESPRSSDQVCGFIEGVLRMCNQAGDLEPQVIRVKKRFLWFKWETEREETNCERWLRKANEFLADEKDYSVQLFEVELHFGSYEGFTTTSHRAFVIAASTLDAEGIARDAVARKFNCDDSYPGRVKRVSYIGPASGDVGLVGWL